MTNTENELEERFEAKYGRALDAWETKADAYHNTHPYIIPYHERSQAADDVFDTILEHIAPHFELIGKATTASVNAFLTVAPTGLLVSTSRKILRDINKKNPKAAQQLLQDIQHPLPEDILPRKVVELRDKVVNAWRQELLTLDTQD